MSGIGIWVVGASMAFLGLVGLVMASRAEGSAVYWIGLGLFICCVLVVFGLIKEAFDGKRA